MHEDQTSSADDNRDEATETDLIDDLAAPADVQEAVSGGAAKAYGISTYSMTEMSSY